jgi:hypothetical protein
VIRLPLILWSAYAIQVLCFCHPEAGRPAKNGPNGKGPQAFAPDPSQTPSTLPDTRTAATDARPAGGKHRALFYRLPDRRAFNLEPIPTQMLYPLTPDSPF